MRVNFLVIPKNTEKHNKSYDSKYVSMLILVAMINIINYVLLLIVVISVRKLSNVQINLAHTGILEKKNLAVKGLNKLS